MKNRTKHIHDDLVEKSLLPLVHSSSATSSTIHNCSNLAVNEGILYHRNVFNEELKKIDTKTSPDKEPVTYVNLCLSDCAQTAMQTSLSTGHGDSPVYHTWTETVQPSERFSPLFEEVCGQSSGEHSLDNKHHAYTDPSIKTDILSCLIQEIKDSSYALDSKERTTVVKEADEFQIGLFTFSSDPESPSNNLTELMSLFPTLCKHIRRFCRSAQSLQKTLSLNRSLKGLTIEQVRIFRDEMVSDTGGVAEDQLMEIEMHRDGTEEETIRAEPSSEEKEQSTDRADESGQKQTKYADLYKYMASYASKLIDYQKLKFKKDGNLLRVWQAIKRCFERFEKSRSKTTFQQFLNVVFAKKELIPEFFRAFTRQDLSQELLVKWYGRQRNNLDASELKRRIPKIFSDRVIEAYNEQS